LPSAAAAALKYQLYRNADSAPQLKSKFVDKPPKNSRSDETFPRLNSDVRLALLLPHWFAAYILIADAKSQPESLTMAAG